ncbi:MAG TPA: hypothetical protein VMS56_07555 [Thermoanaerobaculia bacterium]|nr:hypothetical protein [Thermoanaerobaculia bacterium]
MKKREKTLFAMSPCMEMRSDALGQMLSVLRKLDELAVALGPAGRERTPVAVRAAAAGMPGRRGGGR